MSDSTPPLNWKWRIAQNLAKRAKRKTRQHPVTGYVAEHHLPSLKTREGIAATLALSALTNALKEQNDLQRRHVARLEQRAEQQRSLIEALVQFLVVFLLLISVGGYAAFNWAITEIGGRLNAISSLPGMGWLQEGDLPEKPQNHRDGAYMPSVATFAPLAIATPYLYDDSPPGAWDFTLINPKTDNTRVAIPSPCPGTIEDIGQTKRAGNYLWLQCSDGTRWFMAHLHRHQVAQDGAVQLGQALGLQGSTGNSTGDHVHAVIDPVAGDRTDRTVTKPVLEEAFRFWKQGNQLMIGNSTKPLPNTAVALVKQLEGLQLEAYPDGTDANGLKRWSIGYGTPSRPGEQITPAEAEKRLRAHIAVASQRVADLVTMSLTETQRTALISFEYNTGGLANSGLLRHLNSGNLQAAAAAFEDWVYWVPHGKTEPEIAPGLVHRRKREQQIFLESIYTKAS